MAQAALDAAQPTGAPIEALLTYSIDTGVKPITASSGPDGRLRSREGQLSEQRMAILDGRSLVGRLSLDREGFELVRHDTRMTDFYDPAELEAVYYPEIVELVKRVSGAARVLVFDHTLRNGDEAEQEVRKLREPVKVVHNDYTEWSGPQRVRDLLPDEAEALLKKRVAVIQVWRPIRGPVLSAPLAICDAQSLAPDDLIAAERRHKDRIGEIYHIKHNPAHRWHWFPRMERHEALVFKCYDSLTDGRARFTAHASFDIPDGPPDAAPRESIEMRALVFW